MYLTTTVLQTPKNHEVDLAVLKALCYQSARLYNASLYNVNGKLDWAFQDSVRALVNAPCPRVYPIGSSPRTSVVGG